MSFGAFIFWLFIFVVVFGFGIYFGKQMYGNKSAAAQPAMHHQAAPQAPAHTAAK